MTIEQIHQSSDLTNVMDYARAVSSANLLPDAYRGKPADIMIAVGLGQAMGLSPAESLYRISVIKGKPTASAELIASNVRRAGHRLRTIIAEDGRSATTTIVRVDDPEFEHVVTRDMAWAQAMGLASNDNYKKQAATMLANRSITACARLACPEALYGVSYSSDEMGDLPAAPRSGGLAAVVTQVQTSSPASDVGASDEPPTPPGATDEGDVHGQDSAGEEPAVTKQQLTKIGALMSSLGITDRENALAYVSDTIGRPVESRNELTKVEASALIESLTKDMEPTS